MDPTGGVSIPGNTFQFITLAYTVSSRLTTYCKATSDIPPIFHELSVQIPLVADICQKLQDDSSITPERLSHVLKGCSRILETLNQILSKVIPETGDSVRSKVRKGIKSVTIENKAKECKTELESYKATLTLYLSAQRPFLAHAALELPTYHYLPSLGQAKFIGRKQLLKAIDRVLKAGGRDTCVAVLLGMGGQGKTSLAIEYCRGEKSREHFKTILWINSVSHLSIQRSFAEIAKNIVALSGEQRVFPSSKAQITFIHGIVESRCAPWLFVFDNYDLPQKVKRVLNYAPHSAKGAVIMTTRHADIAQLGTLIPVSGMNEIDAVDLLLERTGHARTISNLEQAKAVVKVLGYLPLAIDQSAAYIRSRKISPEQFLDHYKTRKEKLLKYLPSVWDYQRSSGEDDDEPPPLSVFTTWEMSFTQAEEHSPIGDNIGHFLTILGFFSPLQIRMEMFQAYYEGSQPTGDNASSWLEPFSNGSSWDKYEYQDGVVFVSELSLVTHRETSTDPDDQLQDAPGFCTIALHPLVRDWMQLRISVSERRKYAIEAVIILEHYIISAGDDYRNWPLKIRLQALSHVDATLELQSKYAPDWANTDYNELRKALGVICSFYADNGRYEEAERICKEILHAETKGADTKTQASSTELQLTDIFLLEGRYDEVEEIIVRLLNSSIKDSDKKTKVHMEKNLAKAFSKQGRYDEAASLYHDVLEQQASFLLVNDLDVLHTKENLAYVYRNQGLHLKAIDLYEAILDAYRVAGLEDHLDALNSMVNLASTYRAQAQYRLATPLYEKASKEISAKLHADHPTALSTKSFMAINLRELQRHEEAEHAFRDVVERSARVLGLLHPDTLKATMNFAILCDRTGKPFEAEELYRTTLIGREQKLGTDNPYTLRTVERLVSLLWSQNRLDEALEITAKALKAQQRGSLEEDMKTLHLDSLDKVDTTWPYRPVEILFESAVARDNSKLAAAHRDRIETQKSLARVYESHGKLEKAQELQRLAEAGDEMLRLQLWQTSSQWRGSRETLVGTGVETGVEPSPLMLESLPETSGQTESERMGERGQS
jgi:tetratricopeptide (TPR) repeat protein